MMFFDRKKRKRSFYMLDRTTIAKIAVLHILFFFTFAAIAQEPIPSLDRVRVLQAGRAIADAELVNQDGETFRLSALRGRVALIFFGFTNCPDVCPMTMARWAELEKSGAVDLEKVAFVLISVDGKRDKPAVMKEYVRKFSDRFIGLTGNPSGIKPIAKQFSATFYEDNPITPGGHYNVTHSPQAFVLDTAGELRAEFYSPTVEAMSVVINALLRDDAEYSESH